MPAKSPQITVNTNKNLKAFGVQLAGRRKALGISATATAEAAGISRVTLHRIERGEASVTMGAYLSVVLALGLSLEAAETHTQEKRAAAKPKLPKKIRLANYPQLKRLAWQIEGTKTLGPKEVLDLYERNWRHVDKKSLVEEERKLLEALLAAFGRERLLV